LNKDIHITSLIHRLAQNDIEAFNEIYMLNYNRLLRYGILIHRDPEVVADVIQDLFVWIWQHGIQLEKISNFQVYLFKSLKRNLLRHLSRQVNFVRDFQHSGTRKYHLTIEDRIIKEETDAHSHRWLAQQLDSLPSKQKEVIYLRYYEGLTYDEIAEILSKSNQVVRNYASRALNHMRKSVETKNK